MQIDPQTIGRILIRGTNWVGDAVMTLPALAALRDNFPEAHLTVLARPWVRPIYAAHPAVDRVMTYERKPGLRSSLVGMLGIASQVRKERFDLALLFQNAIEAALIAFLARIPRRAGYDTDGRRPLLTHPVRRRQAPTDAHQSYYYLGLLSALGWRADFHPPILQPPAGQADQVDRLLAERGIDPAEPLVGISPGAIYGPAKRWPPDRFAAVADRAAGRWEARAVIFGSQAEADVCRAVETAMRRPGVNLCGATSLEAAIGVIRRCRLFVTNDSGLMHVAAAAGVPTVAVFGSTDPAATGPLGPFRRVVSTGASCSPCLLRKCPIDFKCMLGVSVDTVWEAMCEITQASETARCDKTLNASMGGNGHAGA